MSMRKKIAVLAALLLLAAGGAWATTATYSVGTASTVGGAVQLFGSTSGSITVVPPATAGSNTATLPANTGTVSELNAVQTYTAPQLTSTETPTISTSTFTPLFNTTASAAQNHRIVLVHVSCPCTLANPASLGAGQSGMFEIVQSATGSDTIGTWGSEYKYVGGTSTITLSTTANAVDYIPYYVDSQAGSIILGSIIKGPAH